MLNATGLADSMAVCSPWHPVARKSLPDRDRRIETGIAGIPFDGESDPEVLERYVALYGDAKLLQWRYV
jgi:hypothetical protein